MTLARYALTKQGYITLMNMQSAMERGAEDFGGAPVAVEPETLDAARRLLLDIPAFDWTIEVDVFGRHRITVHFKGATIAVDVLATMYRDREGMLRPIEPQP